jgi:hypothetical protein
LLISAVTNSAIAYVGSRHHLEGWEKVAGERMSIKRMDPHSNRGVTVSNSQTVATCQVLDKIDGK